MKNELHHQQQNNALKAMQNYMLEHNINQKELAQRLCVTDAALGKWLLCDNGISRRNLRKISDLCGQNEIKTDILSKTFDELDKKLFEMKKLIHEMQKIIHS